MDHSLVSVEEPELHIHPRLQSGLGDLVIQSTLGNSRNTAILETHSEHLILRILRRIRETTRGRLPEGMPPVRPEDVAVLYVEPGPEGAQVRELRIDPQGRFMDRWPEGFFEERLDELF
jgi:predicted ATPase